jgi:tape measure domain-containing protein
MEGGSTIMSSIDQRIVQMDFQNAQFERGVKKSLFSLERLKQGLNLDNASKSLNQLQDAGKRFSLAGIASGVDAINAKFSALGVVGFTVLQNLTNSAMDAGKRIVKSLTIDPIKSGLQEYETKMNAITTILTNTRSKGTTLDDVNEALAELNEYADKTIYNFAEMTRNIGTFTAAGVDLKTATSSIKGIANLAAGSGSNAQQAATAMYQLSQAISSGRVNLMDWNSVVNAGMGGELFRDALMDKAKEMGV